MVPRENFQIAIGLVVLLSMTFSPVSKRPVHDSQPEWSCYR
jgi:hypothetical protein